MHISIVDDEKILAKKIKRKFEITGYDVTVFCGYEDFMKHAKIKSSLYIIDISLGDGSGFDIIEWLRYKKQYQSPILILSGYGDTDKIIYGLNIGADDYIIKPCLPDELIARARALLRRSGELVDEQNIVYKNIVYDFEKFGVFIDEKRIALTVKESMVVEMFMKNINKLLKREQLLSCVWGEKTNISVTDNTINVTLSNLRRKIGPEFDIKTVYGQGYMLQL